MGWAKDGADLRPVDRARANITGRSPHSSVRQQAASAWRQRSMVASRRSRRGPTRSQGRNSHRKPQCSLWRPFRHFPNARAPPTT
eukprot:scaffold200394_cov32-Tisochrysis_lutea.AAC.2